MNKDVGRRKESQWHLVLQEVRGVGWDLVHEWRDWLWTTWTDMMVRVPGSFHLIAESEDGERDVKGLRREKS